MHQLTQQLNRWRGRERLYRFTWGFARWGAIVLGVLAVCCFADWFIDRRTDTPFALRVLMTAGQGVLAAVLGWYLLFKLKVPHIDTLAGQAEEAIPEFGHRLVTALQLNRPGANTSGMSPQLISAVTTEAETLSARHNLASLADASRIEKAAVVFIPVLLVAAAFVILRPTLSTVLLKRQALMNVEIPRSVALENKTAELHPAGDTVRLKFQVRGDFTEESEGRVTIKPEGMPVETYPLKFDSKIDADSAIFTAEVPPSSTPFTFKARLHDGRTRSDSKVSFAPRPVVKEVSAWLLLPAYVDPEGKKRYERHQPQAEVTTLPDCGLRVDAEFSKPVANATVVLFSRPEGKAETELLRVPMTLGDARTSASVVLPALSKAVVAYRVTATDDNGFAVANPPRRGIASSNYQSPVVKLLPEVLKDPKEPGPLEDFAVDGMPLALGGQVQIGYNARSPLGVRKVFIWYRVNPVDREKDPWTPLPMNTTVADAEKLGRFMPELGVFENSGPFGQVEFYSLPSSDPEEPAGLEAGGRYNFQTSALTKRLPNGELAKLDVGDQVEFVVAAFDRSPSIAPGESTSRIKAVVTGAQLDDWLAQLVQSRGRLEELFAKQRRVFQGEKDKKPGPPK
ncbi:hypothetical protein BH11PLA2_BH11PLA2_29410 [soil metagenome]